VRKAVLLLLCGSAVISQLGFAGENKQKSFEAARQRASDVVNIFGAGPLQIRATFHLHLPSGQLNGTYRYSQLSSDEHREVIETRDFSESSILKDGQLYTVRSRALEPLPVAYLRQLIYSAHAVPFMQIDREENSVQQDQNSQCYRVAIVKDEVCFDSATGAMVSSEWRYGAEAHKLQYSNFHHHGDKLFPGTMVRFHNGILLAELTVESINHEAVDEKVFVPPPDAQKQLACKRFQRATAEHNYFNVLSDNRGEGTVVIAGSLDKKGKVLDREVQQSSDVDLSRLALGRLNDVIFRPAKCDGRYVTSQFRLHIWFAGSFASGTLESFP
jgi:hypothetical protein